MSDEKIGLDDIDVKILRLLRESHLKPNYTKIAKEIGLTTPSIKARIDKLEKAGYIKGYTTLLDYEKLGKGILAIIGISTLPEKLKSVINELKKLSEVYELYNVTGTYDLILKVRVKDVVSLNDLIVDKFIKIDGISKTYTMLVLSIYKEEI